MQENNHKPGAVCGLYLDDVLLIYNSERCSCIVRTKDGLLEPCNKPVDDHPVRPLLSLSPAIVLAREKLRIAQEENKRLRISREENKKYDEAGQIVMSELEQTLWSGVVRLKHLFLSSVLQYHMKRL